MSMSEPRPHPAANNFDGLRLVGSLLVIASHQAAVAGRSEPAVFSTTAGTLGVLIFFSISGFLVASSWRADPSLTRFFARRFLRIWPGLATVVILTAGAVFVLNPAPDAKAAAARYLGNLFLKSFDWTFFPDNTYKALNGPLWTIKLEIACYVALALGARLLGRITGPALLALAATAIPLFLVVRGPALLSGQIPAGLAFLPYFGAFYFFGAAMAYRWPPLAFRVAVWALGAIALLSGATALGLGLIIPAAIVTIGRQSWPVFRNAGRYGDLSYGIYVWGWPVQQVGVLLLGGETPYLVLLAVTMAVTVPLAALSWHLVEKQALRLKPSRPRDQPPAAAGTYAGMPTP
jgi:peptidoglycan/LPS O-acetylase OafA/YrhL